MCMETVYITTVSYSLIIYKVLEEIGVHYDIEGLADGMLKIHGSVSP